MEYVSETEIAWAAGFFDGEGCIMIIADGRGIPYLRLYIDQKVEEPIRKLHNLFGGSVSYSEKKKIHRLQISSTQAASALESLLPYLTVKREQAILAMDFQLRRSNSTARKSQEEKERDELDRLKMKELKLVVV